MTKPRYFYQYEILGVIIALAVAQLGSYVSMDAIQNGFYDNLNKSPLNPPNIVFPIVWTILFILMGIGMGRIWRQDESLCSRPYETGLFLVQLGMNFLWSFLFFGLRQPELAFIEIVPFWFLISYIMIKFYKADRIAGLCYLPYVLWVGFAIYLNFYIVESRL